MALQYWIKIYVPWRKYFAIDASTVHKFKCVETPLVVWIHSEQKSMSKIATIFIWYKGSGFENNEKETTLLESSRMSLGGRRQSLEFPTSSPGSYLRHNNFPTFFCSQQQISRQSRLYMEDKINETVQLQEMLCVQPPKGNEGKGQWKKWKISEALLLVNVFKRKTLQLMQCKGPEVSPVLHSMSDSRCISKEGEEWSHRFVSTLISDSASLCLRHSKEGCRGKS